MDKDNVFAVNSGSLGAVLTLKQCETVEMVAAENLVPTTIEFNDPNDPDSGPVGALSWGDGTMKFEGNAEKSAQVFFDNVLHLWNTNYGS